MTETVDMRLPVFPNGYARQTVCVCDPKMIIPARTMIDGKWRAVCMTCGSLNISALSRDVLNELSIRMFSAASLYEYYGDASEMFKLIEDIFKGAIK